jgi:hypothetical protein
LKYEGVGKGSNSHAGEGPFQLPKAKKSQESFMIIFTNPRKAKSPNEGFLLIITDQI